MRPFTFILLGIASLLGGCAFHSTPTLTVTDARITERTADGVKVEFEIDAVNDNDVPLTLRETRYSLSLDGRTVFRGARAPTATLARRSTQRLVLPAVIPTASFGELSGEMSYRLSGSLLYLTPGELSKRLYEAHLRRPDASFGDRGVIDFTGEQAGPTPVEQP